MSVGDKTTNIYRIVKANLKKLAMAEDTPHAVKVIAANAVLDLERHKAEFSTLKDALDDIRRIANSAGPEVKE